MAASIPWLQPSFNFFIVCFHNASNPVQYYEHEANRNEIPELKSTVLTFSIKKFCMRNVWYDFPAFMVTDAQ
jgi:hypothetical protein